jgi:hypothetical protein
MKKFVTTITVLVTVLALSRAAVVQQKSAPQPPAPINTRPALSGTSDFKTIEGRVNRIDAKTKTITLNEGSKAVVFLWDRSTKFKEAGHAVKPSALVPGAKVTVHYIESGGKNWASAIIIAPPPRKAVHK